MTLPHNLKVISNTLNELERMHNLNLELLEQLSVTCSWIMENKISVPNHDALASLLNRSMSLIAEIQADEPRILQYNINRRKVTDATFEQENSQGGNRTKINKRRCSGPSLFHLLHGIV